LPPNNPRIQLWTCRPCAGYGEACVAVCEDDARAPHAWTCHLRAPRLPESDSARPPMAQHPPPQRAKFRRVERPVTAASSDRGSSAEKSWSRRRRRQTHSAPRVAPGRRWIENK
jgi:hypothetical protein